MMTPSVAFPGDTNPSDATALTGVLGGGSLRLVAALIIKLHYSVFSVSLHYLLVA